jgi:dTDP-4-dehydrorhamnose 3,5-epimerase
MKFLTTRIPDLAVIEPQVFGDDRGFFMETWHAKKFAEAGIGDAFVQDNHSRSGQGILRGLHYQIDQAQGKLVRVVSGEVFDVAVDLRKDSACFGQYFSIILSAENKRMLWIPVGFAHGFYVMSAYAEFVYKCTDFYAPQYERCIRWDDPTLKIDWPLPTGSPPILSKKDQDGILFAEAEYY